MRNFRFRKTIKRNTFTTIFGGVGQRKFAILPRPIAKALRTKMQMYRRAAQGWRNQTFGRLTALKVMLQYGKRKPTRRFIK